MSVDAYRKCSKCGITPHMDNLKTFYRFPKPGQTNIVRCKAWARYCWPEQKCWSPESLMKLHSNHKVLCWRHFEDYCFSGSISSSAKRNITKYSVPGERQYVIKLMDSLRREMKNQNDNVEKNTNSSGTPVTGCFTQPDFIVGRTEYIEITFDVPVHRFPNPEKHPDLFMSWVTVIGKKLEEIDPKSVYKSKRICDHHFDPIYKISGGRLKPLSIPSINLYGMLPTCTTFTEIDHSYSRPQRESLPPKPLIDARKPCTRFNAGMNHMNFRDSFQNDHSYDNKVTIVTPARGTSTKKVRVKIDEDRKTCSAIETHQDSETADATHSEDTTGEPSAIDDDFEPSSPVSKVEGLETLFSWQQSELIPADDVAPLTAAELEEQTGISLYCDDTPEPQTVPRVPETSIKEVEYRCNDCGKIIDGFQFWCVQCFGCALCGACEARGEHKRHYVLRAPPHRPYRQTQVVLATIRHQLQNENMLTQLGPDDDGVKLEVKEEPPEEDGSVVNVNTVPREPDPLDAADPLRHEPTPDESLHTSAAEDIAERPFKRPRLADYIERNFTAQVKVTSIPKPHENIRISSDKVAGQVEYVVEESKTARAKPHESIRINSNNVADQVEYVVEESKTAKPKPHANIRINSDDMDDQVEYVVEESKTARAKPHESIRINSNNVADQVEYVVEESKTARAKPHESIRINSNNVADQVEYVVEESKTAKPKPHANIRINSDDMDDQVEYVVEESKTARAKPHESIRINSNNVADQVEYVVEESKTARAKPHESIRINSNNVADQVEYVVEESKTAKPKPHANIRINSDDMDDQVEYVMEELETEPKPHENIPINSDDMDYQVEYLMEELETDDDTYVIEELETDDGTEFTEIEHLDDEFTDSVDSRLVDDIDFRMNETDRIVNETVVYNRIGAESILSDLPRRALRRNIIGYNRLAMRGSPESMVRSLSSEAVVELRPLSSVEIRKWTADS